MIAAATDRLLYVARKRSRGALEGKAIAARGYDMNVKC
jgi:hypothetical protein